MKNKTINLANENGDNSQKHYVPYTFRVLVNLIFHNQISVFKLQQSFGANYTCNIIFKWRKKLKKRRQLHPQ